MNCEYYFGLSDLSSGLSTASLINHFYPEDLPSDWRISYYCNEFELLIIHCSDLFLSTQSDAVSAEDIIEQLREIIDDIDESTVLLFDCADVSNAVQQQLYYYQTTIEGLSGFINTAQVDNNTIISRDLQLEWGNVVKIDRKNNGALFCHVKSTNTIKPSDLRQLLETMDNYGQEKEAVIINVIFSSDHALENCRNAVLLESMM